MQKAVFCDRDGVINVDHGYVGKIEDFQLIDGVIEALASLRRKGFILVLVTNQSGIARGMYTEDDFWKVTEYMQDLLSYDLALFDAVYFCPHLKDATVEANRMDCECRKPKSGMFLSAKEDLDLDMSKSYMVGDKASDLIAALGAKVQNLILVGDHLAQEKEALKDLNYTYFKDLKAFADSL